MSDGRKVSSCDSSGNGYMYIGNARFALDNNVPTLESVPFSGGRIIRTTNGYEPQYYLTDHLGSTRMIVNQDGKTVEAQFDYTPFGIQITNSASLTNSTEYRFSGKELQNIPDSEIYDFGARQYFAKYAIWGSVDPLSETYYPITPYAYCANNPIRFIDPDGMEFTPALQKQIDMFIDEINEKEKRIRKRRNKIESAIVDNTPTSSQSKQLEKLEKDLQELAMIRGEIDVLSASSQVYDICMDKNLDDGFFTYDFDSATAIVRLPRYEHSLFAHELKHAYQFETGALSIGKYSDGQPFYDQYDEVEAYKRGALFKGPMYDITNLPERYSKLQEGPVSATNYAHSKKILNDPILLQNLAIHSKSAFRINGTTYSYK